jgi:lysozyme
LSDPVSLALARLVTEEGFRAIPYTDTTGNLTIGYGCNLSAGWSQALAANVLSYQLAQVLNAVQGLPWWHPEEPVRGSVILDLGFNLGVTGLLHFPNMLAAYAIKDWTAASAQLLDSDAARALPDRYETLSQLLLNG